MRPQFITEERPFYQSPCYQDSGSRTTARQRGGGPTPRLALDQSHHAEQQLVARPSDVDKAHADGRPDSTCSWPADSPTTQANYELFPLLTHPCRSAPFDNTGWSRPSSTDCWSDFETMMDSWFSTNSNSVDRYQLNGHYCSQPIVPDTFYSQGHI